MQQGRNNDDKDLFGDIFQEAGEALTQKEKASTKAQTPAEHREQLNSYYIKRGALFVGVAVVFGIAIMLFNVMEGWGVHKRNYDANATKPSIAKSVDGNKTQFDAGINTNTWQAQYQDRQFATEGKIYKLSQEFGTELNKTNKKIDDLSIGIQKGMSEIKSGQFKTGQKQISQSSPAPLPIKELPPRKVAKSQQSGGDSNGFFGSEMPREDRQNQQPQTQKKQTSEAQNNYPSPPQYQGGRASPYKTETLKPAATAGIDTSTFKAQNSEPDDTFHLLSATSEGTLVTGIVVPTDDAGAAHAVPVKIVLDGDAIQANDERSDLDGCFVIGTAVGNLSTERIDVRLSSISCVITKGKSKKRLEKKVEGWVYSKNGPNGIKGRLVTRTGQELARVLSAGVLQGIAGAFAPTNNLSIAGLGTVSTLPSSNVGDKLSTGMENGLYSGGQNALSMLANYYIKLANKRFPTLEANPGQQVVVEFKGETDLKLEPHRTLNIKGGR